MPNEEWKRKLRADPIPWLLEGEASIRYFALTEVLDRSDDDPEAVAAKKAIPGSPTVKAIVAAQHPEGYWEQADSTYWPKYKSTLWQLTILSELGVGGDHPAVRKGLAQMEKAIEAIGAPKAIIEEGDVIYCYSGNTIRYLCHFGRGENAEVRRALDRLLELIKKDGAWTCPHNDGATCIWGLIKVLRGLAALPPSLRSKGTEETIKKGAETLLEFDYLGQPKEGLTENGWETDWLKFGFPSFYESDLLEALDTLTDLGYGEDLRLRRLLDPVLSKQDELGRWRLENSFNGRMQMDIEVKGEPSRWITLRALRTLKKAYP
ncbi:MAG: hypothetical protein ACE5LG_09795 [Anaerolineae bacterium]